MIEKCGYCHGVRLVGWSGAGPILCPECSRGQDAFTVVTQAWREQRESVSRLERELGAAVKETWTLGAQLEELQISHGSVTAERNLLQIETGLLSERITALRSAANATQALLDAILGACGDAQTVEEAVRWIGRELEEKLALRTERDEAKAKLQKLIDASRARTFDDAEMLILGLYQALMEADGDERALYNENKMLHEQRDQARALAVELGKCGHCGGNMLANSYVPCDHCSGTGLDSRVPKEWASGAPRPALAPDAPPEPSPEPCASVPEAVPVLNPADPCRR